MAAPPEMVELVCIRVGGKLRVRITTPGYLREANCQFPRAIRAEGRRYRVPAADVRLAVGARNFYRVAGQHVEILGEAAPAAQSPVARIYEDAEESACAICLTNEKEVVFAPCGHFFCCSPCASAVRACPICRAPIAARLDRSAIE